MTETTPTRDEAVARIIEPGAWQWHDALIVPFAENKGFDTDTGDARAYEFMFRQGVRTAEAAHAWMMNPPTPYGGMNSVLLRRSLERARQIIAMLASAPAPARGGADAVAERAAQICETARPIQGVVIEYGGAQFVSIDDVNAELNRRAAEIRALSPAATPVSEAEPVATERPYWRDYPADQKVSPALAFDGGCLTINGQGYGDRDGAGVFAFKDDDLRWGHGEDEGYRYIHIVKSELEAIRQAIASAHGPYALAKPASSPAGGDVREALREIAEQDVTEIALDPDWPRRIARAALSQSTSAGRLDGPQA